MKENGFKFKNAKIRQYQAETMIDEDPADDLTLLPNTTEQAES